MEKDLLIISHFSGDFDNKENNRFNYLARTFSKNGFNVELVTSGFSHVKKEKREAPTNKGSYKIKFISEPFYKTNVSLKRFYSHYIMGRNLKNYLNKRKPPDIIYCAAPSLNVAKVAAKYAQKNKIRFIIDIQDLWPEAFKMIFSFPIISDLIFLPMKWQADYIYKSAYEIISVSQTYLNRALSINKKYKVAISVFLGTELDEFDKAAKAKVNKPDNEIWLVYIGTLGYSYDIEMVIDALAIIKKDPTNTIKFFVIGDGPLKSDFEKYSKEKEILSVFTGRLEYSEMVGLLCSCDIAINPIKARSAGSIINKVGDYACAGLPVINTQESIEYRNLLDKYNAGINCENGNAIDLAKCILKLSNDKSLRDKMGKNSRTLGEERFDRKKTYREIVDIVKSP